eukprot:m.219458 g.219458  ORF g.219458 m.219458 type:complete len:53 (+) comp39923_c1_seq13:294-452(+)
MHAVTLSNWNERNQVRDSSNVQLSSVKESSSYHTRSQKGRTVFPGTYTVPLR